jgi:cell division protein FtsW (lipid II flippase)
MSALARGLHRAGIRPRLRRRELTLLLLVALTLAVGWASLASHRAGQLEMGDPTLLAVYLGVLGGLHVSFVIAGRRMDEYLLPAAAMLGGLSLLLMARLPQGMAGQSLFGTVLPLAPLQLVWLSLGFLVLGIVAVFVRNDGWLRRYKYTWAAVGIGLLLLVFIFGDARGGQLLTLRIGPLSGQPSEVLKVILVVFVAGYLAENRALLTMTSSRLGPIRLPPVPYVLPMLVMWGLALSIVVIQRDLGAALLFFLIFLALLYTATQRAWFVIIGLALFAAGSLVVYALFGHVQQRIDIWLNPQADPLGAGYQILRAMYAFGRGGIVGTGLGAGLPQVGGAPAIPAIHTDFVFTALAEELGMLGGLAILALYGVIAQRGLRIAATAADDFRALLATGLTLVIVVQAAIIIGGNLRVIPLTGVTLPLVSYGGSSLLVNGAIVGLLLALSDRGAEPPPLPSRGGRLWGRLGRRARGVSGRVEEIVS